MTTNQDSTIYVTENKQEFVPEVGQECEYSINGKSWYWCRIISKHVTSVSELIVFKLDNDVLVARDSSDAYLFRPLKTEAEINAEKHVKEIWNDLEEFYAKSDCPQPYDTAKHMQSKGYLKPREILFTELVKASLSYSRKECGEVRPGAVGGFQKGARWAEKHIKGEA